MLLLIIRFHFHFEQPKNENIYVHCEIKNILFKPAHQPVSWCKSEFRIGGCVGEYSALHNLTGNRQSRVWHSPKNDQKCTILGVGFLRFFTPLWCLFTPLYAKTMHSVLFSRVFPKTEISRINHDRTIFGMILALGWCHYTRNKDLILSI